MKSDIQMLRQRRGAPYNDDDEQELLPHHNRFSPEGHLLSLLPRRKRQARAFRTVAVLGLVCFSVMLLVAAGVALRSRSSSSRTTAAAQERPNDQQHHAQSRSRHSQELHHSKSKQLEQVSLKPPRIKVEEKAVKSDAAHLIMDRDEPRLPLVPTTGNVAGVDNPNVELHRSPPRDTNSTALQQQNVVVVSSPLNITYLGNSTTQVICPGGSIGILNDNYCDCSNGLDETATSACSHLLVHKAVFVCKDGAKAIFSSRVGDGIIDCADGSDEHPVRGVSPRENIIAF